ncbi:MAG: toll/interleukin-1 receptor domain-containing protein, partial [Desulfobacterales bacterium]|nr:toll/interleukin-1 receptor domain-containing protein [Desulfobacterales bacterium]
DEKISPGEDWPPEIQHAIETSRVAVCLVSANFLNSKFIRNREIPELLKRRKAGLKLLPVLVEPCAWKFVPWLAEIQIKDQAPLSGSDPGDQKEKLAAIAEQVAEIFDDIEVVYEQSTPRPMGKREAR